MFHLAHHHLLRGRVPALVVDAVHPDRGAVGGAREALPRVVEPGVKAVVIGEHVVPTEQAGIKPKSRGAGLGMTSDCKHQSASDAHGHCDAYGTRRAWRWG